MRAVRNRRDFIFSSSRSTGLTLALWLGAGATLAQTAAIPDADWRGSMSFSRQPLVAMRLSRGAASIAGAQRLQFGAPLNCSLSLLPQGAGYRVEVQNGGAYCDRFWGGSAMLRLDMPDSVNLRISGGKGATLDLQLRSTAQAPSALAGRWSGAALRLRVADAPLRPGDLVLQLSYPSPRDCAVEARYAGHSGQALVAAFVVNAGGYCGRLSDGYALVSGRDGKLVLEVFDGKGARLDAADLTRQP
jgi:hypothetical protein